MSRPNVVEKNRITSTTKEGINLELEIYDPVSVAYLNRFEGEEQKSRAIEALKVGIIAIQSASPTLDTNVVQEKFQQLSSELNRYIDEFNRGITSQIEEYFKTGSGVVPRSLDSLFGDDGKISFLFKRYFDIEDGKVAHLIQERIGPASHFAKCLDPSNKDGVICQIQTMVQSHLEEKTKEIIGQLSLDKEDSAISRFKSMMDSFLKELREAQGIEKGATLEAERGTQKGRDFESLLYERIADWGRQLEDQTENVTGVIGSIPRCKTGDYLIILGETCGAPGVRLAIEVKKQSYRMQKAVDELKEAKENREAMCGIMLFAKGYEPPEIGDFRQIGVDFFATVEEEALNTGGALIYAECAYKLARATAVTMRRKKEAKQLDFDKISQDLNELSDSVKRISELIKKARKINSESTSLETLAEEIKDDMEDKIEQIIDLLK